MVTSDPARLPYPGLRPFEAAEADLFFGREQHVDALLTRLSRSHFVAVVGESGAGKSSLVRAGLLPALEAGFVVEAGADWRVAVMRPGGAPLKALADALLAPGVLSEAGGSPQREFTLAELRRGPLGLVQLVRDARLDQHSNLLIVVDQFEELFRYGRDPAQKDQGDVFVELLLQASRQRQAPIYVVLTMRSDFMGDCARFRGLPEMMSDNQYLTPRLTRDEIAAAIREPARVCGGAVDAALVDELCNAVGHDPDQLPLLQHLLMRIWQAAAEESATPRLTVELAKRTGGLHSALNDHAQQIYDSLPDDRRAIARSMFKCLTDPLSHRRDLRRDALVHEVAAVARTSVESVIGVADAFRADGRHMLMPPPAVPLGAKVRLDISHESLIRHWKSLREWALDESMNAREFQSLREEAIREQTGAGELLSGRDLVRAQDWLKHAAPTPEWAARYAPPGELEPTLEFISRSEAEVRRRKIEEQRLRKRDAAAKRARMYSWLFGGALVLAFAVAAAIFYFWQQASQRNNELQVALSRAHALQLAANARNELQTDPALAVLLARQAVYESDDEQAIRVLREALSQHVPYVEFPFEVAKSTNYIPGSGKSSWLEFSLHKESLSPQGDLIILPSGNQARIASSANPESGRPLPPHGGIVGSARFSPDGKLAVTTSADFSVGLWDVATGQRLPGPPPHGGMVNDAVFNVAGTLLVTLGDDELARVWTVGDYAQPRCELKHDGNFVTAEFSHDQNLLVTVTHDFGSWQAQVWRIAEGGCDRQTIPTLDGIGDLRRASFSPYGPWLGVVTIAGETVVLNTASSEWPVQARIGANVRVSIDEDVEGPAQGPPPLLAWSADGKYVAAAGADHVVRIAAVPESGPPVQLRGHTGRVTSISFHPSADILLTTSVDRTARLWKLDDEKRPLEVLVLKGHGEPVGSGTFSATGNEIATAADDGKVRVWKPEWAIDAHRLPGLRAATYSPDGGRIWLSGGDLRRTAPDFWFSELIAGNPTEGARLSGRSPAFRGHRVLYIPLESSTGDVAIWDVREPFKMLTMPESKGVRPAATTSSPDGRFVVGTARSGEDLRLWDLNATPSRPERLVPPREACDVTSVFNDRRLAWYCADEDLVLVTQPGQPTTVEVRIADKTKAEFMQTSMDGLWLAAAFEDHSIRVFNTITGANHVVLRGHEDVVESATFSADARFLVSTGDDGSARVWDVASGVQIASAANTSDGRRFTAAVFSPDARSLLLVAQDRLLVWRCYTCGDTAALLDEVDRRRVVRTLTGDQQKRFAISSDDLNSNRRQAAAHPH